MLKRLIALLVCFTFSLTNLQYVYAQDFSVNQLPVPGMMVGESALFAPMSLKGLVINPQKPLELQFLVDTGKGPQGTASIKEEANKLVKYFLAGLTIPEGELWVNLSPYEKNRITTPSLGQTELGRDLLAQDYILKQLTASLIYPEKDLGKEFWSKVYSMAQKRYGTTNVPINTFNKVWILPDQAQVFENGSAAYVTRATLKVMLDEDYLAKKKHQATQASSISSQIIRQIVLPEISKEVNEGKNFAPLRQIYDAMILAKWYKETIANRLLNTLYTNKDKIGGISLADPAIKEQIYQRYIQAYKKGVFNYIKETQTLDGKNIPRKYFSGGFTELGMKLDRSGSPAMISVDGAMISLTVSLVIAGAIGVGAIAVAMKSRQAKRVHQIAQVPRVNVNKQMPLGKAGKGNSELDITPEKLEYRRGMMENAINHYRFEFVSFPQILRDPNILSGINRLERNMGFGKMPEPLLMRFLATQGVKILVATDPKSGEIIGYTFGLPQSSVPKKVEWETQFLKESFYEISRQVLPKYQSQGIGSAMRMKLMQEAIKEGFKYFASNQNDAFSEADLDAEIQNLYGLRGKLIHLQRDLDRKQQYLVFRLPNPMSNIPKAKLLELIESKNNDVMFNAASALSEMLDQLSDEETKQAWIEVVERLHNPDPGIRQKAIITLQSLGMDPTAVSQAVVIGENYLRSIAEAQQRPKNTDEAMQTTADQEDKTTLATNGGIDLNQINVNRTGKSVTIEFDQAQLNELTHGDFEGFMPVITGFKYIQSPLPLLGINSSK